MSETPQTQQLAERKQVNLFIFHKEKKKDDRYIGLAEFFQIKYRSGSTESQTHTVIQTLLEKWVTAGSVCNWEGEAQSCGFNHIF